ncbi:MAG: PEP-CTERM sorting domain-containing protein [Planctomycetota bacterium]
MKVQKRRLTCALAISAGALVWLVSAPAHVQAEPLPPELAELFEQLGIEVDSEGTPVPPPTPPSPVPAPDPVDPLDFLAELGIIVDEIPEPSVPLPTAPPTPTSTEPQPLTPAEIELFAILGIVVDDNGNPIPPEPAPPVAQPDVIDTEEELIDFFASIGITLDGQGVPIPAAAPADVSPAPPVDPIVWLAAFGLPTDLQAASLETTSFASPSSVNVPEPTSVLLLLGASAGLLACRGCSDLSK